MRDDFTVFIPSHGRAGNIKTIRTIEKQGYTGNIWIVIDNEDDTENEYYRLYKNVYKFDKKKYRNCTDTITNEECRKVVVYARNAMWDIAKELGYKYFLVLDDDYQSFDCRYRENGKLKAAKPKNLDDIFEWFVNFLEESNAYTITMAQGGDFIGGAKNNKLDEKFSRKAMNSFFCKTDRPFMFLGKTNEDVNAYVTYGQIGALFGTVFQIDIVQTQTQANEGGLTDVYLNDGTYVKSFYSVICAPSCVKVAVMGDKHQRIHHSVDWEHCTPKILNEKHKK